MNIYLNRLKKHQFGGLYAVSLGIAAAWAVVQMCKNGMYEAALVDLAMAVMLIFLMLKKVVYSFGQKSSLMEKGAAWGLLAAANVLALLPSHEFPGNLSTAFAYSLLLCAVVLYFSGKRIAAVCIGPAVWCFVFMPYHEEFMLLLSFPLRLSATMLSAGILKLCGINVVFSGTSLALPGLDIAITDACSGISQLDAFILIAVIIVQMLHKKTWWKVLHLAFIIPSVIAGNGLRIVLTVLLYKVVGETVLQDTWHITLGYVQIILALLIFLAIGKIFKNDSKKTAEDKDA
jgi:exosortase